MKELHKYILSQPKPFIPYFQSISKITDWLNQKYYKSKDLRLTYIKDNLNIPDIVISIWEYTLINKRTTYQQICGSLNYLIKGLDVFNRVKSIAEIIAICAQCDLITIEKTKDMFWIYTEWDIDLNLKQNKHLIQYKPINKIKPMLKPEYKIKHQPCIDHLQRMNSIQVQLNNNFIQSYKECPNKDLDDQEYWDIFIQECKEKYKEINNKSFYFEHKYDARGRCYPIGYHVNYQGMQYKKESIVFKNKQLISKEILYA